jgi:hypothetical protein
VLVIAVIFVIVVSLLEGTSWSGSTYSQHTSPGMNAGMRPSGVVTSCKTSGGPAP